MDRHARLARKESIFRERVRREPTDFFVAPGHMIPAIEKVIDSTQNFEVVRKLADEGELARKTDPRS